MPFPTTIVLAGNRGSAGRSYLVQASTNLVTPPAQWTVVGSNVFDSSGNFAVTNVPSPGTPQEFYRIKVP